MTALKAYLSNPPSVTTCAFFQVRFLAAALLALAGCGNGSQAANPNGNATGDNPVLWMQNIATPDGVSGFMGFAPEPPTEPFDLRDLIELGPNARADAFNGMVFSLNYEDSTITRWSLSDDLQAIPGEVIGLSNDGLSRFFWQHAFYSDTRAFVFNLALGTIIEWNPSEMVITARHVVEPPEPATAYTGQPYRSGDRFLMMITGHDYEAQELNPRVQVAIFDPEALTLTYATDDRVISGYEAFVDGNGDFYALPDREQTWLSHYFSANTGAPIGGVLRIKAGEDDFDPDYYERLDELAGASAVAQIFPLNDTQWLVEVLPDASEYPPVDRVSDFWQLPVTLRIVDLEERTWEPVVGLDRPLSGTWTNERRFYIDGVLHYAGALFFPEQAFTRVDVEVSEASVDAFTPLFTTSNAWPLTFKRISSGSRRM